MQKIEVLGETLWICTRDEARQCFTEEPLGELWRVWSEEEWAYFLMADAEEVQRIIDKKKKKPGNYLPR